MKKTPSAIIFLAISAVYILIISMQTTYDHHLWRISTGVSNGDQSRPFDFAKGNNGVVVINKIPEKITASDVKNAYKVKPLYHNAKNENTDAPHLWTASEVGLQDGTMQEVGEANVRAILSALSNDNCIGFQLDKIYNVKLGAGGAIGYPESFKKKAIVLPRDFVIDGEVDGKATGGFHMDNNLFYTEYSLNMHKVHVTCSRKDNYKSIYINPTQGIDQLQFVGCVFDYGYNIFIDSPDVNPLDGKSIPVKSNYINHIYVEGCTFRGPHSLEGLDVRVVKSCRFINNKFTNFTVCPLIFSTNNKAKYAQTKVFMSCPIYIAGNTFEGNNYVYKSRYTNTGSSVYCCAFLIENSVVYALQNSIKNIVSGRASFKYKGGEYKNTPETYDAYLSCQQVYFTNNIVKNIARFTSNRFEVGIFKSKNINMGYVKGGKPERDLIRYYKNNNYSLDCEELRRMWQRREYNSKRDYFPNRDTSDRDYQDEKEYDMSLTVDERILSLTFNPSVVTKFVFNEVTFSNNLLDAGEGSISGNLSSNPWHTRSLTLCNNTFKSKYITSGASGKQKGWRLFNDTKFRENKEALFVTYLKRKHGSTKLTITGNKFIGMGKVPICLLINQYSANEDDKTKSAARGDIMKIQGNTCPIGSTIVLTKYQRIAKNGNSTATYREW